MTSFSKRDEKIQHATKRHFSHYFYTKKNHEIFGTIFFFEFLKGVQNQNKIQIINDLYWLLVGNFF